MYQYLDSVPIIYWGPEFLPCSLSAISGKVKQLDCLSTAFQVQDVENKSFDWKKTSKFDLILHPNWSSSIEGLRIAIVEALKQQDGINTIKANEIFDKNMWWHILIMLKGQYQRKYNDLHQTRKPEINFNFNDSLSIFSFITSSDWSQFIQATRESAIKRIAHFKGIDMNKAQPIFEKEMWYCLLTKLNEQYYLKYENEPTTRQTKVKRTPLIYANMSLKTLLNPSSSYYEDFMPIYQTITYCHS